MANSYEKDAGKILDELLKYHSAKELKALLNKKERKKSVRGNNYFDVAVEVYKYVFLQDYMLERAIDSVAIRRNISSKTIKNHLRKYRKLFKSNVSQLLGNEQKEITKMIKEVIPLDLNEDALKFYLEQT